MNEKTKIVYTQLIKGQGFKQICQNLIGNPNKSEKLQIKRNLKAYPIEDEPFKELLQNLKDQQPLNQLKKLSKFCRIFKIKREDRVQNVINQFIENHHLIPNFLKYLDQLIVEPDQAQLVLSKLKNYNLSQFRMCTNGEISKQLNNYYFRLNPFESLQQFLQQIISSFQKNQKRGLNQIDQLNSYLLQQLIQKTNLIPSLRYQNLGIIGQHQQLVNTVQIAKNEQFVISGGNDKRVLYWSLVKNETKLIGTHDGLVLCLSISQSSTFVVSGGADNKIMLWNLIDSGNNREIGQDQNSILSIDISQDDQYVITGGRNSSIKLWNLQTLTQEIQIGEHQYPVQTVRFSYSGNFIISGSRDFNVRLWNLQDSKQSKILGQLDSFITSICISKTDQFAISGEHKGQILFWDLKDNFNRKIGEHEPHLLSLSLANNDTFVVSGGSHGQIILWYIFQENQIRIIGQQDGPAQSVSVSQSDNFVASCEGGSLIQNCKGRIIIWSL